MIRALSVVNVWRERHRIAFVVLVTATILVAGTPPASAHSAQGEAREHVLATCIRRAARGHAWLQKTLWGLRDQEAGWIGAAIANADGSHDLGPLQINSWWVPRLAELVGRSERDVARWLRDDACFNADAARWIFLSSLSASGDYWKAIGLYHSPTIALQRPYATQVASRLRRRFGEEIFDRRLFVVAPASQEKRLERRPASDNGSDAGG